MTKCDSRCCRCFLVGEWKRLRQARVARTGLVFAVRRGLGVRRAAEFACEAVEDPAVDAWGETGALEWLEERHGIGPPAGWSVEIKRWKDDGWRLQVHVGGRRCCH